MLLVTCYLFSREIDTLAEMTQREFSVVHEQMKNVVTDNRNVSRRMAALETALSIDK